MMTNKSDRASLKLKWSKWLSLLLLVVLVSGYPASAQESPLKEFDDYVNKALKDWEVPGIAIAIVKNDQIVFSKGYGVR
ncbi:MAG TPA: hypothetical protein VLR90_09150, partial [Blastocatellia bacterium]|nr:hypothetical protein [Blastocatellia bacterium]